MHNIFFLGSIKKNVDATPPHPYSPCPDNDAPPTDKGSINTDTPNPKPTPSPYGFSLYPFKDNNDDSDKFSGN